LSAKKEQNDIKKEPKDTAQDTCNHTQRICSYLSHH